MSVQYSKVQTARHSVKNLISAAQYAIRPLSRTDETYAVAHALSQANSALRGEEGLSLEEQRSRAATAHEKVTEALEAAQNLPLDSEVVNGTEAAADLIATAVKALETAQNHAQASVELLGTRTVASTKRPLSVVESDEDDDEDETEEDSDY